jgi:hypothetical protein
MRLNLSNERKLINRGYIEYLRNFESSFSLCFWLYKLGLVIDAGGGVDSNSS